MSKLFVAVAVLAACSASPTPAAPPAPPPAPPAAAAPPPAPEPTGPSDVDARRDKLDALLAEHWEYTLKRSPEMASTLGDKRYNDKWSDRSFEAIEADLAATREFLARFEAISTDGFAPQKVL